MKNTENENIRDVLKKQKQYVNEGKINNAEINKQILIKNKIFNYSGPYQSCLEYADCSAAILLLPLPEMYRLHEPQLQIRPIDWSAGTSYRPKPSSDGSNELFKRGMISKPSIEMGQCQSSLASQIYKRVSTLKNSLIIQCSAQFSGNKTIRFYIPVFCIGLPRMEMLS